MMNDNQTQYLLTCSILRQMKNAGIITAKEYPSMLIMNSSQYARKGDPTPHIVNCRLTP